MGVVLLIGVAAVVYSDAAREGMVPVVGGTSTGSFPNIRFFHHVFHHGVLLKLRRRLTMTSPYDVDFYLPDQDEGNQDYAPVKHTSVDKCKYYWQVHYYSGQEKEDARKTPVEGIQFTSLYDSTVHDPTHPKIGWLKFDSSTDTSNPNYGYHIVTPWDSNPYVQQGTISGHRLTFTLNDSSSAPLPTTGYLGIGVQIVDGNNHWDTGPGGELLIPLGP